MSLFERVPYTELNARQQENYNFHKVAAILADYGYTSMRLSDDWLGADFIAYHRDGKTMLRIQLKGRLTIDRKYDDKDIYIAFRDGADCYVYPHDTVRESILSLGKVSNTKSWQVGGNYAWPGLPVWAKDLLAEYKVS